LRVEDITDRKYPSIYADELATKARAVLRERGLRTLPVVDEIKRLLGVITRNDMMAITSSVSPIRVEGIMSTPRLIATPDMDARSVMRKMLHLDEWYVPVVKSSQNKTYNRNVWIRKLHLCLLKERNFWAFYTHQQGYVNRTFRLLS